MSIDLTAFPKLTAANHRITSDPSPIENCIAWAAGHSDAWWEPFRHHVAAAVAAPHVG
jgi:hypothetical protein